MKAEIIIPRFDNDGSDNAAVIDATLIRMCGLFGGATAFDARGYWVNDAGRLFRDDVVVMVSAATDKAAAQAALVDLARSVLAATDQEAVFVSVGDDAQIIE